MFASAARRAWRTDDARTSEQSRNKVRSEITRKVVFDVESGNTVADAMGKHPQAYSNLYVNMVAPGEAGGILDTILMRLATSWRRTTPSSASFNPKILQST